jgi:hypothetical protein
MHGARVQALTKVVGQKNETKSADEQKRAKVATDIQAIYDRTKADVTKTLDALDGKVDDAFTKGESTARSQFENYVDKRMSDYMHKRYGGWTGGAKWLKDKVVGMPDEVNRFYDEGKRGYLAAMDGVIGEVADIVGTELTAARTRIADGRAEVQKYVAKLPADLRDVGKEAADKLESQFEQLSSDVDSSRKRSSTSSPRSTSSPATPWTARIEELQAANKGWVNKALDAVVGVVNTILKLKDMLMSVLARAADAIGDIIKDPIGFLGNLIDGVKGGLNKFVGRIGTHLQEGMMGWLFGALGSAGITMPKSLDFQGILDLVLQVLGLTYQNVRARIAKLVGEPLVAKMEKTVDVIRDFASKGIAGAWEWIKDKIGDLEDMVLGQIKEFVIEKVIKSGIVWIIALLNPAAAFVKACKAIYDIVMFIVERGSQIMEFVNSIIDSISAIAKGSVGVVVDKIEGALAKALPLAISFLASLLGLGGISEKIRCHRRRPLANQQGDRRRRRRRSEDVQEDVRPGDEVGEGQVREGRGVCQGEGGGGEEVGEGQGGGGEEVGEGQGRRRQATDKSAVGSANDKSKGKNQPDERSQGEMQSAVDAAVAEVESVRKAAPPETAKQAAKSKMAQVRATYRLNSIGFGPVGDGMEHVVAQINPTGTGESFSVRLAAVLAKIGMPGPTYGGLTEADLAGFSAPEVLEELEKTSASSRRPGCGAHGRGDNGEQASFQPGESEGRCQACGKESGRSRGRRPLRYREHTR